MNKRIRFALIFSLMGFFTLALAQGPLRYGLEFFGGVLPGVLLVLVLFGVAVLVQTLWVRRTSSVPAGTTSDPALQILRERFAKLEIDPADYEARRRVLTTYEEQQTRWPMYLFRIGFAGVFLINALVAVLQPRDFLALLQNSLATNWFPWLETLIPLIALNDLAIAVVILFAPSRYRPYVYAWTGLWFLAITVVKLLALRVFAP